MDWLKAILYGSATVAIFLALSALVAILLPIAIFALIVVIIWVAIQIVKSEPPLDR